VTENQFRKDLAQSISRRRQALGLTQSKLAKSIGLTQDWISHYEGGRRAPSAFIFWKLQKALQMTWK